MYSIHYIVYIVYIIQYLANKIIPVGLLENNDLISPPYVNLTHGPAEASLPRQF